jgi:Glutaredoxin-related protein
MFILQLATVDVLSDEAIRQGVKEFSDWPTIPQVSFENMPGPGIIRFKYT